MVSFNFHPYNSDSDSDCIIADCKEGEDCITVTDKPSPKRCKLEPEKNLNRKLIPGDGHCIDKQSFRQTGHGICCKFTKV